MDSTAEFEVAAESDGKMIEPSFDGANGQKVCECLRGMLVSAVSGIDNRNGRAGGGNHRCAFFGVAHRADISEAGNHADGV